MRALANLVGVQRSAVYQWRRIPVEPRNYVLELEAKLGISRYVLRPDVYAVPYAAHPHIPNGMQPLHADVIATA